ncbi:MAG: hypothetical protein Kow0098_05220 [Ignavibacteriaceae bacterium]
MPSSKIAALLFILTILSIPVTAQEKTGDNSLEFTVPRKSGFSLRLFIPDEFRYEFSIKPDNLLRGPEDSSSIRLRTEMSMNISRYSAFTKNEEGFYLTKPLFIQYENEEKLKTVKYILGMAQLSAVGYLAYKHIKKYGFLR